MSHYSIIINLLLFLSLVFSLSQEEVITVDDTNGNDTLCKTNYSAYSCKTLYTALKAVGDNLTTIHILNGTYPHNTTNTSLTYNNVTITGNGRDVTIVECNNSGTGFGFLNINYTTISGLTLSGCGQLRNSTTPKKVECTANGGPNVLMLF